jgi:hypothetical protein
MKKGLFKKVLAGAGITFLLAVVVLSVHIYMVTRPQPLRTNALIMARIDFKQDLKKEDAVKITAWLYQQNGVDHVLCNPAGKLAVFTFYPSKTSAEQIIAKLNQTTSYTGKRFLPTKEQLAGGCPVAYNSFSYQASKFFTHLF